MSNMDEEDQKDNASTTKDVVPQFIITPVATLVDQMKSVKQSTLTQMLGINDDDDDDLYTSDPDFVSPKKAKKETVKKRGHNTPVKSCSFVSKVSEDRKNPHCVKIGDLIMSTASEINHPDYLSGRIGGG